jgi:heat shock protein HtpX
MTRLSKGKTLIFCRSKNHNHLLMNNALKSWSFLIGVSLTLIVLGHFALGREGLLIGLIVSLGINSYVYFFEDQRIVEKLGGQLLEGHDPWGLLEKIRRLSATASVPTPRVVVLPSPSPQALVVGRSLTSGTLLLTEGLLVKLEKPEIDAVIAYLLACMKNMNTLAFAVGSFVASTLLAITETLDAGLRLMIVEKKNPNYLVSQFFTRLAAPFIGTLVRLSIRPSFYSEADRIAVEILGESEHLATALWKLHSYSATIPYNAPIAISHMFVVNPLTTTRWTRYFHAQPRLDKRIRALVGHFPI